MVMKGFETTGRMTVEKFERLFQAEFGVYCDLIDQKGNFADESATLASLRPDDFEGPKKVDFSLRANMQVGNVIKKVKENFGIDIIIYELAEPEEKSTLASVSKFTYLKQQKKIAHNSDELDKIVASLEDEDENDIENKITIESFHVLRFGITTEESESDFIDNINPSLNTIIISGMDKEENSYLVFYFNEMMHVIEEGTLVDNLDELANFLKSEMSIDLAKALLQSGYENSEDGILDHLSIGDDDYFQTSESDDVEDYSPCNYVLSSVTYDVDVHLNLKSSEVEFEDQVFENPSSFYGAVDEDETFVYGVYIS